MEKPDVVVGTPSRVLNHLQQDSLKLRDSLELLVMDEADLLFSFGFEEELKSLLWYGSREEGVRVDAWATVRSPGSWRLTEVCFISVTCPGFIRLF